ncbi:unnamed protein product [Schistocephalus solidus]|uniref:Cytochrome b561 domain-containing protein n=1 Tax=Schistocephalus solidus TaxID=70667 RepID=A0A183TII7_SCHSO|nr:unnamed protein product [Schistocephalus solidus]
MRILSTILLGFCIALALIAVNSNHWKYGNLFYAQVHDFENIAFAVGVLHVIAILFLMVAFSISLVRFCNDTGDARLHLTYIICLNLGVGVHLVGILVYMARISHEWSYLSAILASTLGLIVSILAIFFSRCRRSVQP